MVKNASDWCYRAKRAMSDQEISVGELAKAVKRSRSNVSSVINGTRVSRPLIDAISEHLGISNEY